MITSLPAPANRDQLNVRIGINPVDYKTVHWVPVSEVQFQLLPGQTLGWREAVAASGGRMATEAELAAIGL